MTDVGDVLRFTACGKLLDQRVCNVLYLVVAVWTGNETLDDVAQELIQVWAQTIKPIQSTEFVWERGVLDNVTQPSEGGEHVLSPFVNGDLGGDPEPPFVALSFRQNRQSKLTRNGYKRIAGIPDSLVENGIWTPGVQGAFVAAIENLFINAYTDPEWEIFPAIVGRDASGAPDLARVNFPASITTQAEITTQNTRKFGRGD